VSIRQKTAEEPNALLTTSGRGTVSAASPTSQVLVIWLNTTTVDRIDFF